MRFRFVVDGRKYSAHKDAFKALLKEHGLKWRGNRTEFVWIGTRERVRAEYERDEARDVTVRATLAWEGKAKTRLLNDLKAWVFQHGGTAAEEEASPADRKGVEAALSAWDQVHRPDEEAFRAEGRPEPWIARDVKDWKRRREAKRKELLGT